MRIVIKVGTSTIAHQTGMTNIRHIERMVKVISDLKNAGHEVILVSSGAIGIGVGKLALGARPSDMPTKQAAAAVGQVELMFTYDKLFGEYNHTVAQVLITGPDMKDDERYRNFMNTVGRLLELHVLPILNENDTVSTEEIGIGENDTLGAIVAVGVHADLYIILSDIDGLFTADPRRDPDAKLVPVVGKITADVVALAGGTGSKLGSGGMATKLKAAMLTTEAGCDMAIINGARPELLYEVAEGRPAGTRFIGRRDEDDDQ